jgi:putative phosphoribosyl transferase
MLQDRTEAGRLLGARLAETRRGADAIVLALPRGGVPVAAEVADALDAPLDLIIVRKLGLPWHPELAMGAIASGGVRVINDDVVRAYAIAPATIEQVVASELVELGRRERAYRGGRPYPELSRRTVILVDDGLATGATMRAAAAGVRQLAPRELIVAVPVAPQEVVTTLRREVDDVVALFTPSPFLGVGQWYADFSQTTDDEVRALLERAWGEAAGRR